MTGYPAAIERLLRRVRVELRLRRAERGAWRGAFWGALAAVAALAMKGAIGALAVPLALALLGIGALAGALLGACRRVDTLDAARLADRALRLDDRVATSLEYAGASERSSLVGALLADTTARLEALPPRRMVARVVPREARALALPVLAAVVLAAAPPLPDPQTLIPEWFSAEAKARRDQNLNLAMLQNRGTLGPEALRRDPPANRDAAEGAGRRPPATAAENPALFQDKALIKPSADFSSFVKRSDERLRVLGETDKLPDLRSDFASSKYRALLRKHEELAAGLRARQLSPKKLAELLSEMERLGRKIDEEFGSDAFDGYYDAMERGQTDEALEAMENALSRLREQEGRGRDARRLRGGREPDQAARDDGERLEGAFDESGMEGEGVAPGLGRSTDAKGRPRARLRSTPYTSGVQGAQRGRVPLYETQVPGSTSRADGQLPSVGVFGQYRRLMEDAIAREQVPRDYHEQIRDYFKSLNER
ncbi:MAG TPA: hypothetical protein VJM14_12995 [Burkholderiales bacterium]|nr:hypothetical protein [Burkholderiales bacterium]